MITSPTLPNLSQLKKLLKISPINTNQSFTDNGQACGIVYDNNEGLHAQLGINGKIQLRSGVEMTLDMYRGQNQDYTRCVPTLAREKSIAGKLLKLCQRIAFE